MVEVRNLSFSYAKRQVLKGVSFDAAPGELVCLAGGNGAGKTTLLKVMATLAYPKGGTVALDGIDAFARPLKYRRQLGYLPEKIALYDDMTVREYLYYRANLKGEPPRRVRRRVNEASEMCLITDLMKRTIGSLSAGEKKRVGLADALMLRPRILLLDDFLAGIDSRLREVAGSILANVAAFSCVVASGHELDDFARIATRFLVLKDGVIASSLDLSDEAGRMSAASRVRRTIAGEAP